MMERLWSGILNRFGEGVTLHAGEVEASTEALVQPCLERSGMQEVPGPAGLERREQFRYLGPALYPLDTDTVVEWRGKKYRVRRAQLVGQGVCPHWWAVLEPREEAAL